MTIPRLQGSVGEVLASGNTVTMRPEISGKAVMLGSLTDVQAMAPAIPGIVPCIDFAHLHARLGDGAMNTFAEWMPVLDSYCKSLGDDSMQHLHIHLSGINYGPKGGKNHLVMEEPDKDF